MIDFAKSICGKGYNTQLKKAIAMLEADDTYVSLCMTNDVFTEFESVNSKDIRDVFAPLVEKYYRCEFIYYYGDIAHYKPNAIYMTSLAGEKQFLICSIFLFQTLLKEDIGLMIQIISLCFYTENILMRG